MARKRDSDIVWRSERLEAALRERVDDRRGFEAVGLAGAHLESTDARTAALAHALFWAATYAIDSNDENFRARTVAAQRTRTLSQAVTTWAQQLTPIVEDNLRRRQRLGANAQMFPANEIPERALAIVGVIGPLRELADLLARQLYHPDAVPTRAGKPVDFVLNEITQLLHGGGFSIAEIANLTDRQRNGSHKRVRHRLKAPGLSPGRIVTSVRTEEHVKPRRRASARARARGR